MEDNNTMEYLDHMITRSYLLSGDLARTSYCRALGPAWDLFGVEFDPIAARSWAGPRFHGRTYEPTRLLREEAPRQVLGPYGRALGPAKRS